MFACNRRLKHSETFDCPFTTAFKTMLLAGGIVTCHKASNGVLQFAPRNAPAHAGMRSHKRC